MLEGWVFALAGFGAFLAGLSKGGFGGSLGFASSAILAMVVEPGIALALMLPVLMAIDVAAVRAFWGRWHRPSVGSIVVGAVPGLALGAALFLVVSADGIRLMIGLLAVGFVLFRLGLARGWIAPRPQGFDRRKGWVAGMAVGFTSFVAHAGGPPFAVFMLGQGGIGKTEYHATSVIVFWVVNVLKAAIYAFMGLFSLNLLGWSAALVPFALVGAGVGVWAHGIIPERQFFAVAHTALFLTGLKLMWDGLI